ncbi:MAG: hypothetical protein ACREHD_19050 [Pirellulales bacterium]
MLAQSQLSIRLVLAVIAMIAAALGAIVATPSWQAGALRMLVAMVAPACFIAGTLHARGWLRTFCAGALAPTLVAPYALAFICSMSMMSLEEEAFFDFAQALSSREAKVLLLALWAPIPIAGLTAVLFRLILPSRTKVKT